MKYILLVCILMIGSVVNAAGLEFKTFTLQYRFANDLLPSIQPLVGEEGSAGGVDNHLWIRTTPERMEMVETMINTLDAARKNLRITISHDSNVKQQGSGGGVSGRGRVGDVGVDVGGGRQSWGRDGFEVELKSYEREVSNSGSEFVTVMDGERAFIRVGQSVPFTQQWALFTQRYLHMYRTTEFYDMTTGFAVRPRSIGGMYELEVTPRIASSGGRGGIIDFEELSTTIRVSPGSWVDIGGTMQARDEVSSAILSGQQSSQGQQRALMIRVDE